MFCHLFLFPSMQRWWGDAFGETCHLWKVPIYVHCAFGDENQLCLLKGRQQRHRLSTNRHPFYDPHAVAAVVNTGFLGFLWRLLREKLTTRKRYWLLYIWLATLGSKCVMRRSRLDSREIQAQNPHLSVCVCPMLLAGATSTAYGDLCRRRS